MAVSKMLSVVLCLVALCWAAPTKIGSGRVDLPYNVFKNLNKICASKKCLFGKAEFEPSLLSCVCPNWPERLFPDPCGGLQCRHGSEPFYSVVDDACYCGTMEQYRRHERELLADSLPSRREHAINLQRRQTATSTTSAVDTVVPTFIPPPKQSLTPELLNQSLTVQPQNTSTISGVIPYFRDDVLQVYMQMNGLVADTLVLNASASFPCDTIGLDPEPNLAFVPKVVQPGQGQPSVTMVDCQCIGVNMYSPNVITFWVQKIVDGTIFSVVGSNKVMDINQIDTSQSTALSLVTVVAGTSKRSLPPPSKPRVGGAVRYVKPVRRQIFHVECGAAGCPFLHMHMVKGSDGYCGCMFKGADQKVELVPRGIVEPSVNNAKMTAEACHAMTCFNNGNKPAVFNPFTLTCWCNTPPVIESNPSAWTDAS